MIKRVAAALFVVAISFGVLTTVPETEPVDAHKKWDCRVVGESCDKMTGICVQRERCVCVEHKHGNTMEGDNVPTDERPEDGTPEG